MLRSGMFSACAVAYNVDVRPEPVGPLTTTNPRGLRIASEKRLR